MQTEAHSETEYLAITVLIALCQFLFAMDFNAVNVALATIGRGLMLSPALLSWVMSSYFLPYAGLLILGGKTGDLYGRRLPCVVGLCCFGVASVCAFLAPDLRTLLIARCVQGIGCAFMIPTTFSLINVMLPPGKLRHRAFAVYGASQGLAMLLGLNLGGWVTTHFGWHAVFLLNLPTVVIALALALRFVPGRQGSGPRSKLDSAGAVLITAAIAALLLGISASGSKGLASIEALSGLGGALVLLLAFGLLESRLEAPLLPLAIFRHVNLAGADLACIVLAASVAVALVLLNLNMQQAMHLTAEMSGMRMLPFAIAMIITGKLLDRALARFQLRPTILVSTLMTIVGAVMLSLAVLSPNYVTRLVPAMVVFSIGSTVANITLMALATASAPPERQGLATGVLITCQQIGMALGVSACLSVLDAGLTARLALSKAFALSFLTAGAAAALGLIVVLSLTRGGRRPPSLVAAAADALPHS